ncbi:hypothetical protein [Dyadobacter sediminis]|uniref:Uncharacterized protein n=1 Tax=Dyadobacter sediminis TaxID=1493691 RepID=A0A5R9KH07_9BACT|nr:hypothetical protein [Dyadobacter sediminis]TLU95448.1 hypothetical protein FEM55_07210 [Dyadobacter sediminis]GGC14879.1 hypothetical protein GCM10011325_47150 [Dyadobacter sediminis]
MNKTFGYLLLLGLGLFASCEDRTDVRSETFCAQAKFVRRYHCTSSESVQVVELMSPNPLATQFTVNDTSAVRYYAAMLDLPDSVLVADKTFHMQFHRDKAREKKANVLYCTQEYALVNILVCESILQSCP